MITAGTIINNTEPYRLFAKITKKPNFGKIITVLPIILVASTGLMSSCSLASPLVKKALLPNKEVFL